jgi:hypothetical protein
MAEIINIDTDEVLFESDDPATIVKEANRISEEWHEKNDGGEFPIVIRGFDSQELESGEARPYEPPTPPPPDKDRIVINEEENTVTLHGDVSAPDGDYRVIEA